MFRHLPNLKILPLTSHEPTAVLSGSWMRSLLLGVAKLISMIYAELHTRLPDFARKHDASRSNQGLGSFWIQVNSNENVASFECRARRAIGDLCARVGERDFVVVISI
jgi:hypothetical protein